MKLKIHDNSIRLRLRRSEIARFGDTGRVEGAFVFGAAPDQRIVYALVAGDAPEVSVQVEANRIAVAVPRALAAELTGTDRVGVGGEQAIGGGQSLSILVEKEFRRVHGQSQDPDLYPNPLEKKAEG
jgi:hypothetical protein